MRRINAGTALLIATLLSAAPRLNADENKDDYVNRIYIANADGSDMKPLVKLPEFKAQNSPTWSQDGKLIGFEADGAQGSKVIVVNADGSNPRVLGDGCMPSFSPKAKRIAYYNANNTANDGVWVRSVDDPGNESLFLDYKAWGAQWSPDGERIVYATYASGEKPANLVVFDLVEGTRESLFDADTVHYRSFSSNFKWSPDGRRIVFRGEQVGGKVEIGIVDARGARHGLITRLDGNMCWNFAFRPDGRRILFSYRKDGPETPKQLFTLDPDTKDAPERLPGQDPARRNYAGAFSPDGKKLAMVSGKFTPPKKKEQPAK